MFIILGAIGLICAIIVIAAARASGMSAGRDEPELLEWPMRDVPVDRRTAAHEAGHAILAWVSPSVASLIVLTLDDPEDPERAVTRFSRKRPVTGPGDRWDSIAISLGGIAGEGQAFGCIKAGGGQSDLVRARAWAEELAAAGDPMASCPWPEPSSASSLDVGRMYVERPAPLVCDILNKAFRHAKDVIRVRPDKFVALTDAAESKRTLSPSDMEVILGPRPWAR